MSGRPLVTASHTGCPPHNTHDRFCQTLLEDPKAKTETRIPAYWPKKPIALSIFLFASMSVALYFFVSRKLEMSKDIYPCFDKSIQDLCEVPDADFFTQVCNSTVTACINACIRAPQSAPSFSSICSSSYRSFTAEIMGIVFFTGVAGFLASIQACGDFRASRLVKPKPSINSHALLYRIPTKQNPGYTSPHLPMAPPLMGGCLFK